MKSVGKVLKKPATFYLTGGATAILFGFRAGTIDIDITGDMNELFSHIPKLKEQLNINIELAKPTDFVPNLPDEAKRHILIDTFGKAKFLHFDPYSQAFSKIVRAHTTDITDVKSLVDKNLVDLKKLYKMVKGISDKDFAKYPRLTRPAVENAVKSFMNN
ncbi:MAG: hypothetical protein H7A33_07930 [Deltaproteobacteria bacterium]|nr:hypothetical protein [Deltaproteobacteria bacterium]